MKIIGDVHGKLEEYRKIIDSCNESICVGDFGFKKEWDELDRWFITGFSHMINMGNHDYHPVRHTHRNSLGNWNYSIGGIFTVAGADSIDKHLRTEGVDWFRDEELSYMEGVEVLDKYLEYKPKIVVTHDCPQSIMEYLFGYNEKSKTRQLLQVMFWQHQPDLWIFGHHHQSKKMIAGNTQFVCLDELETFEI